MTIERAHFEGGYLVDLERGDIESQLAEALRSNTADIQTLPEGDYRLTPEWWTKHLYEHNLTVLSNGTAIYRAIPREEGVGTVMLDGEVDLRNATIQRGGKMQRLPQDTSVAVVMGPRPDRKTMGVYEVILFHPGPNPRR